jgi:hypothetical protein
MRPARLSTLALALLALVAAAPTTTPARAAGPPVWRIDPERSLFAVLTHRAGFASGLAHDHLIVARGAETSLGFDPADPSSASFRFSVPVLSLDVDPTAERATWAPRLVELGALSDDLPEVPSDDRAKVRESMLGSRQLNAEQFPTIAAELVGLERRGEAGARVALGWNATVRVSLHGRTIEKAVPVRWEMVDGELTAEALGELRFTEFDIAPYSAVLGAVKNADLFHLFVRIVARPAAAPPPAVAD